MIAVLVQTYRLCQLDLRTDIASLSRDVACSQLCEEARQMSPVPGIGPRLDFWGDENEQLASEITRRNPCDSGEKIAA
jgi:hypothetical protein